MGTTFNAVAASYLKPKTFSRGTRNEYQSTLRRWDLWGHNVSIEELRRKDVREFLDWVNERAVAEKGENLGRTANKVREQLRAVISRVWEQELLDSPPRFPKPRPPRDVAGRHSLTKAEINALYFATHRMRRPRGWDGPTPVGRFWRAALIVFFKYGWAPARSGRRPRSTCRSSGGTCRGPVSRRTGRSRSIPGGGGCTTAG